MVDYFARFGLSHSVFFELTAVIEWLLVDFDFYYHEAIFFSCGIRL